MLCGGLAFKCSVCSQVHSFKGEGSLCSVCFSPDGRTIAGGSKDGFLRIYDAAMSVSTAIVPVGKQPGAAPDSFE